MAVPMPACAGSRSACADEGRQFVRKLTRWVSSSPEILKRVRASGAAMRACLPATRGCVSAPCCRARTRLG
eukprot:15473585-Alexandrium_andersonii.AAC.1